MARKRYENFVADSSGNTVIGASATFYDTGGVTPATIYSVSAGGSPIADSTVTTDTDGKFWAFLEDGVYDIQVSHPSLSTLWLYGVESIAFAETERTDNKGVANGYCPLDENALVPALHLGTAVVPTGAITMFGGSSAPSGWVLCDGSQYSSTSASTSALFNVIGYTFGQVSSDFRVPNFNGRSPIGAGMGSTKRASQTITTTTTRAAVGAGATQIVLNLLYASYPNVAQSGYIWVPLHADTSTNWHILEYSSVSNVGGYIGVNLTTPAPVAIGAGTSYDIVSDIGSLGSGTTRALGTTYGSENGQLTVPHMPRHDHAYVTAGSSWNYASGSWNSLGSSYTNATGGGKSFDHLNPFLCVNFIIKL